MKNISRKLLVLAAPLLLVGCGKSSVDPYADLNKTIDKKYNGFYMEVVTEAQGITLTSTFTYALLNDTYVVDYEVQSLAPIDASSIANNMIKTETGTQEVEASSVNFSKFKGSTSTYKEIEYSVEGRTFEGTVINGAMFLGVDYEVEDLEVVIRFSSESLETIDYVYTDASNYRHAVNYRNFR